MKKLGMRAALTMLVIGAVATTALLIHLSWNYVARKNVGDMVEQLNRNIVDSVHREFFSANYNVAWSTQEAVRSILTMNPSLARDNGKVEALFLSLLESEPGLSWIGLARPDGNLVAVHRVSDQEIYFDEITWGAGDKPRQSSARFARNDAILVPGAVTDIPGAYKASDQAWFTAAIERGDMFDSVLSSLPGSSRAALGFAAPLPLDGGSVILVAIDLDRLGLFLDGLQVGKTGSVVLLAKDGGVIAAADAATHDQLASGRMLDLAALAQNNKLLRILKLQLDSGDPLLANLSEPREFLLTPKGETDGYFINFSSLSFEGWIIATIIPGSDFLAAIDRNSRILVIVLLGVTLFLTFAAVLLADRLIALPLIRVTDQLTHIETFDLDAVRRVESPLREVDNLSAALMQMSRGLASFQKYMPTSLVRTLVSQGIEARPGGQHQELTVLFSDIKGFTGISETLGGEIVPLLTDYLNIASTAILAGRGTIDKFIGDAVMAFWGAPIANPSHAIDACAAALDFQVRLRRQRPIWQAAGLPSLEVRIGINSGSMLVGNIGSNERLNYTVIGDAVNISSRLESLNKLYGT